jgi:uncharacterized phiE125 gp8 family phage protein
MRVVVITPPEPIVTWEEAKAHLRLDGDEEQTYVEGLIAAAQGWIEGPDGWLGRALGVQTLEVSLERFCSAFMLPILPVISIVEVRYRDASGVQAVVPAETYGLTGRVLSVVGGAAWPATGVFTDAVKVRYLAGYGRMEGDGEAATMVNDAPAPIRHAILLLVGQWFAFRSNVAEDGAPAQLPFAVEALLSPFRVWS